MKAVSTKVRLLSFFMSGLMVLPSGLAFASDACPTNDAIGNSCCAKAQEAQNLGCNDAVNQTAQQEATSMIPAATAGWFASTKTSGPTQWGDPSVNTGYRPAEGADKAAGQVHGNKAVNAERCQALHTELDTCLKKEKKTLDKESECNVSPSDPNPESPGFALISDPTGGKVAEHPKPKNKKKIAMQDCSSIPQGQAHQQCVDGRKQAFKSGAKDYCNAKKEVADKAKEENKKSSGMNMGQLMQAAAMAAAAIAAAMANKKAADDAGKAAAALSPQGLQTAPPVFAPATNLAAGPGDVLSPMQPTVISGDGSSGAPQAIAAEAPTGASSGDLGTPFRTDTTKNGLPDAGGPLERAQANQNDPGKGGAGGLGANLSTGATTDKSDAEAQAQQAANRGNPAYDAGAGGNHGGSMMGDKGADLSGMLSQFLPKKDEDPAANKGILEFGDRAPASGSGYGYNDSILGKGGNIFFRIHDTLQNIQKKDRVGI